MSDKEKIEALQSALAFILDIAEENQDRLAHKPNMSYDGFASIVNKCYETKSKLKK